MDLSGGCNNPSLRSRGKRFFPALEPSSFCSSKHIIAEGSAAARRSRNCTSPDRSRRCRSWRSVRRSAPDRLVDLYIKSINDAVAGAPEDVTFGVHMCRGNFKGHYLAAGGYESVAERFFSETRVNHFLLEYDTERAGDFAPLRFVKDKGVMLGLISSKVAALECPIPSNGEPMRRRASSTSTASRSARNAGLPQRSRAIQLPRRTNVRSFNWWSRQRSRFGIDASARNPRASGIARVRFRRMNAAVRQRHVARLAAALLKNCSFRQSRCTAVV
jgi:hypothetical protein